MTPRDQPARRQMIEALVDRVLAVYQKRHGELPPAYPRERVRKKIERKLRLLERGKPFAADRLYRACSSAAFLIETFLRAAMSRWSANVQGLKVRRTTTRRVSRMHSRDDSTEDRRSK